MVEDSPLPFALPSVQRKKVTAGFVGGRMPRRTSFPVKQFAG